MSYKNLLTEVEVDICKVAQTAGTGDVAGDGIDMEGFDGVMFVVTHQTGHGSGSFSRVQFDSELAFGDTPTDLEGTKVLATTTKKTTVIDVNRPLQRYLRLYVERGPSETLGPIYAFKYKARTRPTEQPADVGSKVVASPAAGTP